MMRWILLLVVAACGSKTAPREETGANAAPPPPPPPSPDAAAPADVVAASLDAAPVVAAALPEIAVTVPTKAAALQAWLVAGHYKQWAHESKTHESDGPHGDAVKTFVSPSLVASLRNGGPHAKGAAAVKELYKAGAHSGWAVSVKVADDSASGKGWYWYEVFSTAPKAKPDYDGVGKLICRDCHTEGGVDQVLIPFPLQ